MQKVVLTCLTLLCLNQYSQAQLNSIILGRPTDNAITASIMFENSVEFYFEYGPQSGLYTGNTPTTTNVANTPNEIDMTGLSANTQYYYRVQYRSGGVGNYTATPEYSFHTQRTPGSTFTFTIEADEHLYDKKGVANMYNVTLANELADRPDFMLSLGDIFGDDHTWQTITSDTLDQLHRDYRPFLGRICHSVPFYVCLGNHEGENDYYMAQNPGNNLAVWGTQWRKFYYPNPYPNGFYTGNTDLEAYGIGNPENYYAWTWGDAQFIVLDVYRDQCDTSAKPTNWAWSLGQPQYDWLKTTLETSTSQYKFVFAHHVSGQGRGGIIQAQRFEWGGHQPNGNYTFPQNRPNMEKPIHQLFVDNGVNVFFQGHDHVFAHEVLDSVIYQAVPMPSDSTYEIGFLANADAYVSDTLDGTGHIRVTVSGACVTVDYVRAYLPADTLSGVHHNGEVAFSYTIGQCAPVATKEINSNNLFKVLPNPAKDGLSIQLPEGIKDAEISLQNAFGQKILSTKATQIDVSSMANGMYFLSVEAKGFSANKRVVVNH